MGRCCLTASSNSASVHWSNQRNRAYELPVMHFRPFSQSHTRRLQETSSSSGLRSERSRYSAHAATAPVARSRRALCTRRTPPRRSVAAYRIAFRVPRGPLPSLLYDRPARCAVVASRNPTWRCGSV
ncbi:hypothetical protein EVAR_39664_1 [Eumeta japonica]|uniref:Uncharacterized protein n=1 Tax=Eumeta variegata TaxID=151549 RepID=A0A4C1Z8P6_EUMVA|nr:hypothetical protein EVAR_39664_1 [Eumeta japonica]